MSEKGTDIPRDTSGGEAQMSFWDHLEVLRWALIRIAAVLVILVVVSFMAMPHIFDTLILGPASSDFFVYKWFASVGRILPFLPDFSDDGFHVDIININVASQFMTHISTSFWLSLVLLFPYIVYELWKFVSPALYRSEKSAVGRAFFAGTFMFYLGCAVGYCLIFPFTFRFLAEYQVSQTIVNQISLNSYMNNFLGMVFIMGVVFELPLLAWLLSRLGILHREFLQQYRRHAVVVLLILAAVITPTGDPFSLMLVFVPLYLLYEFSVRLVRPEAAA